MRRGCRCDAASLSAAIRSGSCLYIFGSFLLIESNRTAWHSLVSAGILGHWRDAAIPALPRLGSRVRIPSPAPTFKARQRLDAKGPSGPFCFSGMTSRTAWLKSLVSFWFHGRFKVGRSKVAPWHSGAQPPAFQIAAAVANADVVNSRRPTPRRLRTPRVIIAAPGPGPQTSRSSLR